MSMNKKNTTYEFYETHRSTLESMLCKINEPFYFFKYMGQYTFKQEKETIIIEYDGVAVAFLNFDDETQRFKILLRNEL